MSRVPWIDNFDIGANLKVQGGYKWCCVNGEQKKGWFASLSTTVSAKAHVGLSFNVSSDGPLSRLLVMSDDVLGYSLSALAGAELSFSVSVNYSKGLDCTTGDSCEKISVSASLTGFVGIKGEGTITFPDYSAAAKVTGGVSLGFSGGGTHVISGDCESDFKVCVNPIVGELSASAEYTVHGVKKEAHIGGSVELLPGACYPGGAKSNSLLEDYALYVKAIEDETEKPVWNVRDGYNWDEEEGPELDPEVIAEHKTNFMSGDEIAAAL